jgi:dipeptidyl aminopeptidase/acylaminoacyl peptidase
LHHPAEIYVSSLDPFVPKKITSINEKINLSAIKAEPIQWKSFDDLEIEGILTYPQGYKEGTKVPLVVSIHGGRQVLNHNTLLGVLYLALIPPLFFLLKGMQR